MEDLHLQAPSGPIKGTLNLPASKSESNRAQIIAALSGGKVTTAPISSAKDSQIMEKLLAQPNAGVLDVGHAGTVMRFMTAYLAFSGRDVRLQGTGRMHERPIGPLVDALREVGAVIEYAQNDGFPPLMIRGSQSKQTQRQVSIPGNISSQFISALLMIAPTLPNGLKIRITGTINSRPYIEMTLDLLAQAGIFHHWLNDTIDIPHQQFKPAKLRPESDWSAASYAYSLVALRPGSELWLPGLRQKSIQGDSVLVELMEKVGVQSVFEGEGVRISSQLRKMPAFLEVDFSRFPDLAQTLLPLWGVLGIRGRFTGLETLHIKETDRIAALQAELAQFGIELKEPEHGVCELGGSFRPHPQPRIRTYEDHRMAMGFAPLVLRNQELQVEDPTVVEKSFPDFWDELKGIGLKISPAKP